MPDIIFPSPGQSLASFHRERREAVRRQNEERSRDQLTRSVIETLRHVHDDRRAGDHVAIRAAIDAGLPNIMAMRRGRESAAAHEIGHFIAFKLEGMDAGKAVIFGVPGDPLGWGGAAKPLADLYFETGRGLHDFRNFCRKSRTMLAGPIAKELVGDGNAFGNFPELIEARIHSDRAAELMPEFSGVGWIENVFGAAAMVEQYALQINSLAEILAKRREITRWQPSIRKVLETIKPCLPMPAKALSPKGEALARRIIAETPSAAGLLWKESAK